MRTFLASLIWLLDLLLKVALGHLIVALIWLPFGLLGDTRFGRGWLVAGGFVGACLLGFFDGCDIILNGWARRYQLDLRANGVDLVHGRIQASRVDSDSRSSLVDAVGEAAAQNGSSVTEWA